MKLPAHWEEKLVSALRGIAAVSALFCLLMAVLLLLTAIRLQSVDPLESPALAELKQRLASNPSDDALAREIRALDLLARKAYFTERNQIDSGALLLAIGFAIFVASLRFIAELKKRVPDPTVFKPAPLMAGFAGARKALIVSAAVLTVSALAASLLVGRDVRADFRVAVKFLGLGDYPSAADLERNWPFFRGPDAGRAHASDAEAFGSSHLSELWRAPVGLPGMSSPVVWGARVYLTGATAEEQGIFCFSVERGELLWRRSVRDLLGRTPAVPEVSKDTGWAAPTPACDGRRLFVMFASGQLICLDLSGSLLWYKDFGTPENPYGIASSPVVWQDEVIVQFDQSNMSLVVAFQSSSGRLLWRHERKQLPSWASPIVVGLQERPELIVVGNPAVEALDPDTGRDLWQAGCMWGDPAPSPASSNNRVFVVSNMTPVSAIVSAAHQGGAPGDISWSYEEDLPDISSPLATAERLYLASSVGTISCLDAATGKLLWKQGLESEFSSSPILVGGTVFVADRTGTLHRFADADTWQPLPDVDAGGPVSATPAYCGGRLFLRAGGSLVCYGRAE